MFWKNIGKIRKSFIYSNTRSYDANLAEPGRVQKTQLDLFALGPPLPSAIAHFSNVPSHIAGS
jgi:hypothetical protein